MSYKITVVDNDDNRTLFDKEVLTYMLSTLSPEHNAQVCVGARQSEIVEQAACISAFRDACEVLMKGRPALRFLVEEADELLADLGDELRSVGRL